MLSEESVWDYPRPPRLEPVALPVRVVFGGFEIAATDGAMRVLETSHPPTYYLPPSDIQADALTPASRQSICEFKGRAQYFDVSAGGRTARAAAWCYPAPTGAFAPIAGYVALYASMMEECWVGEARVLPQEGDFYGGWITSNLKGPFKGGLGTRFW